MKKRLVLLLAIPFMLLSSCGSGGESIIPSISSFSEESIDSSSISVSSKQSSASSSRSSSKSSSKSSSSSSKSSRSSSSSKSSSRSSSSSKSSSSSIVTKTLKLNKSTLTIAESEKSKLIASVNVGTLDGLVWSSDDEDIATVDKNGEVTGVKPGKTVITATLDDLTASCSVTIRLTAYDKYMMEYFPLISYYSRYEELTRNKSFKPTQDILEQYIFTIEDADDQDTIDFYGVKNYDAKPSFNNKVELVDDPSLNYNNLFKNKNGLFEIKRSGKNLVLTLNVYIDHYTVYLTGGGARS